MSLQAYDNVVNHALCRGDKSDDDETDAETSKLRGALSCMKPVN